MFNKRKIVILVYIAEQKYSNLLLAFTYPTKKIPFSRVILHVLSSFYQTNVNRIFLALQSFLRVIIIFFRNWISMKNRGFPRLKGSLFSLQHYTLSSGIIFNPGGQSISSNACGVYPKMNPPPPAPHNFKE